MRRSVQAHVELRLAYRAAMRHREAQNVLLPTDLHPFWHCKRPRV